MAVLILPLFSIILVALWLLNFSPPFSLDKLKTILKYLKNTSLDGTWWNLELGRKLIPSSNPKTLLNIIIRIYSESFIPDHWRNYEIVAIQKSGRPLDNVSSRLSNQIRSGQSYWANLNQNIISITAFIYITAAPLASILICYFRIWLYPILLFNLL